MCLCENVSRFRWLEQSGAHNFLLIDFSPSRYRFTVPRSRSRSRSIDCWDERNGKKKKVYQKGASQITQNHLKN